MQVVKPVSMELSQLVKARQFLTHLGKTKIFKAGCIWLSKADWKELDTIILGNMRIIYIKIKFVGRNV